MEHKFALTYNGQSLQQQDVNLIGETAGLADDRVFAELFRMAPFDGSNVARGILPYAESTSGDFNSTVASSGGGNATVFVRPFRAFIGSTTAMATDARKNWQDIRSGLPLAAGSSSTVQSVVLAANSSGNPRWDLVYAAVNIAANGDSVSRKVKDTSTLMVTSLTVTTNTIVTVTLGVVAGTPSATPEWPATPADSGTTYYIPLAYVRVPNGFNSSSVIASTDIAMQAPLIHLSRSNGGRKLQAANSHNTVSFSDMHSWGSTGTRKKIWIPPDIVGGDSLIAMVDLSDPHEASWTHPQDGVIDSRDWRYRFVKATVVVFGSGGAGVLSYPWNLTNLFDDSIAPGAYAFNPNLINAVALDPAGSSGPSAVATTIASTMTPQHSSTKANIIVIQQGSAGPWRYMDTNTNFTLYVDHADSGKLKFHANHVDGTTAPGCFVCWLDFSGPYLNK